MSYRKLLISIFLIIFLAGCAIIPGNLPPTFIPEDQLPTLIEMTAQALVDQGLVTPLPTETLSPDQLTATAEPTLLPTDTSQPSVTPSPTLDMVIATPEPLTLPDPLPQAEIQIISPGRLSRVRSPFRLHLFLAPPRSDRGEQLSYQLTVYGNDGRVLVKKDLTPEDSGSSHKIEFVFYEIQESAETARVEIRSLDNYGRTTALVTTELVLLSEGDDEIKAIKDLYDNLVIQQPIPSTLIQGDKLIVQGVTRYAPDNQLVVEMIDRQGSQIGSGLIRVSKEELGFGFRPFEGEVPYQVGKSSWIRVQVIARDRNFSGTQHLSSVEVLVSP
jgi:hypothetical protein